MAPKSNVALLTEGAAYIQRAKKARREQVEEIKFDDEARREWLTGFSKRKKAKVDERRARAKERDHKAHLEERKKARQELKERAAQNVKEVREALGLPALDESDSEDEAGPSSPRRVQEEYADDEQLATVTITEDFDLSAPARPFAASPRGSPAPEASSSKVAVPLLPASSHRAMQKAKRSAEGSKDKVMVKERAEKERNKSMETKGERRKGRQIEARNRNKQAAIAMERDGRSRGLKSKGGKGGPKGGGGKGPKGKGAGGKRR